MRPAILGFLGLGYLFAQPVMNLEKFAASTNSQLAADYTFKTLFNGKNFDGWFLKLNFTDNTLIPKTYGIQTDSGWVHIMKDLPDNFNPNTTNNLLGMMFTTEKYSHYVLRWEYKWGTKVMNRDGVFKDYQYDAGVYFHNTNDWIFPTGLEYQIRYDHVKNENHTGDAITTSVICDWFKKPGDWRFSLPENGGVAERSKVNWGLKGDDGPYNALNGKWNKCELIVMGKAYALYKLNGKIVNYLTNLSVGQGTFGFQAESAEIFYRNIEVMVSDTVIPYSITKSETFAAKTTSAIDQNIADRNFRKPPVSIEKGPGFMNLFNHSEKNVHSKIWTSKGQIMSNGLIPPGRAKKYNLPRGVYNLEIQFDQFKSIHLVNIGG
jgi:Domain of Unknown Function (DUF1080)